MKRICVVFVFLLITAPAAIAEMQVVTTLASYAALAKTIGGDLVSVSSIASPRFNPHFIEPKPSDVFRVKKADLFIHSGLDLEAWRGPLLDAAARSDLRTGGARELDLSRRVRLLQVPQGQPSRAQGDIHQFGNPHYWIDPRNGRIIAEDITAKLAALDPEHAGIYDENLKQFLVSLDAHIARWQKELAPFRGKELIGYHNEWIYLSEFMGLKMDRYVEPKPGIPPAPKHLEELQQYIAAEDVKGIVQASFYPKEAVMMLHEKTGIALVTICQNVGELPECSDYLSMIDFAVKQTVKAIHG